MLDTKSASFLDLHSRGEFPVVSKLTTHPPRQPQAIPDVDTKESQAIAVLNNLGFNEGDEFQIGISNYSWLLKISDGHLTGWNCKGTSDGEWHPKQPLVDPWRSLLGLSRSNDVFIFPNKLVGGMSNRHATEYNTVFFEIDPPKGSDVKEQLITNRARINAIQARGLVLSAQIYSGNKSDHNYFRLSEPVTADVWLNLMRKAAIAMQSDPTIVTLSRKMRFPGVYRSVKGNIRTCKTRTTEAVYSAAELEKWFNLLIKENYGVVPPDYISEERFREYKRLALSGLKSDTVQQLLIADERDFQQKYDDVDLSHIPTEILQPIALKALNTIPESIPGEGSYEEIYRRMCGGLKNIFGEEEAVYLASQHSPQRDAKSVVRSLNRYNAASLFKVAREHGGFSWEQCDAEPLQDFFREDVLRCYASAKGRDLSIKLSTYRKQFQLLGCPDSFWKDLCNQIAVESDNDPIYGASEEWWALFEAGQVGRGSYLGEGNPQDTPEWIRENQVKPWLNRMRRYGDRLFSYRLPEEDRIVITPDELTPWDGSKLLHDYRPGTAYTVLYHNEEQRYELVTKSRDLGYRVVIDAGKTGVGKTHNMIHFGDGTDKILLLLPSARNPHVKELGDLYFEMPTRHGGLYRASDGRTVRQPEHEGQQPVVDSTCHKTEAFLEAERQGINLELNSPCFTCIHNETCGHPMQNRPAGSGFRMFRKNALKQRKIRGHHSQFSGLDEYFLKDRIAVVDEAGEQLKTYKTMTISFTEIDQKLRFARRIDPARANFFMPFINHLKELSDANTTPFPVGHDEIIESTKLISENEENIDNIYYLKALLTANADGVIDWNYCNEIYANAKAGFETHYEPLSDLMAVWFGDRGSISVQGEEVTVTVPDNRMVNMLKKCQSILLMDATPNLDLIAQQFGIHPSEILVITRPIPDNSRLSVTIIDTPGTKSRQSLFTSEQCQERVQAIIDEIRTQRDENARVLGLKNCPIKCSGWWGNHTRGDNSSAGVKTLITYGLPYPNLEACKAQFRAMTGGLEGFQEYYNHLVAAEIIQAAGRQRAHRFDGEFELFMICSDLDPRFLKSLGCKVNVIHAAQINPKFGTESQYRRFRLAQMASEVLETGKKLTQAAIAEFCGVTQQAVQQMAAAFPGGWKAFRKEIQGRFIKPSKGALYFDAQNPGLDDWQGFTPLTAISILAPLLETKDLSTLKLMLEGTVEQKKDWVVALLLNLFEFEPAPPPLDPKN